MSADSHKTVPHVSCGDKTVPRCQLTVTRLYPVSADSHKTVPLAVLVDSDKTAPLSADGHMHGPCVT